MAKRVPPWAYSAIQQALAGAEPEQIATALSKTVRQVNTLLGSEWATAEMATWHKAVMDSTAAARMDPILQFQSEVSRCIKKLITLTDAEDEKVQYLAACRLLDNAGFKPAQRLEVAEDRVLQGLTPDDMRYVITHNGELPPARSTVIAVAHAAGAAAARDEQEADGDLDDEP